MAETEFQMPAKTVIECAIGLFDKPVSKGKYPPRLADEIVTELDQHGYEIVPTHRLPPAWCWNAPARVFVMANALAAPLLVLAQAWLR